MKQQITTECPGGCGDQIPENESLCPVCRKDLLNMPLAAEDTTKVKLPSGEIMGREFALRNIAISLQGWIDWEYHWHRENGGVPSNDKSIIAPPYWPTIKQLKNWVAVLRGKK